MLSVSAFNALLKVLEEPPPYIIFVFATTESSKVLATIVSRCQKYDFRRMDIETIVSQLKMIADKEKVNIDEQALLKIAKKADGSMRDSQSIFDQLVAFCGNNIDYSQLVSILHLIDEDFYFRITDCIHNRDLSEAFSIADDVIKKGYDFRETLSGLLEHFRNLLVVKATGSADLVETSKITKQKYVEVSEFFTKIELLRFIQIVNKAEESIRFSTQPKIKFELALAQLTSLENVLDVKELIEEIRKIDEITVAVSDIQIKSQAPETPAPIEPSNTTVSTPNEINTNNRNDTVEISELEQNLVDMFGAKKL